MGTNHPPLYNLYNPSIRVITTITNDRFVGRTEKDSSLTGICVDLWHKTAKELNLTYDIEIAGSWADMVQAFKENRADVIMQRMDESQMKLQNVTK